MKHFFRIFLSGYPRIAVDYPRAEADSLQNFVTNIQLTGFVMHEQFYVPAGEIRMITPISIDGGTVTGFVPRVVS